MSVRLRAIFKNGAFVPVANGEKLHVAENTEVELTVHNPYIVPATAKTEDERERAWNELLESWDTYPLRTDAPRLTRAEMHERR